MRKVRDLMTPNPHTIGEDELVSVASRRMRELGVRHLPVVSRTSVVGLLSEREVCLAEALEPHGATPERVGDMMVRDPYVVDGAEDLAATLRVMAQRKLGSVIVTELGKVAGIFTSIDALSALADRLEMT